MLSPVSSSEVDLELGQISVAQTEHNSESGKSNKSNNSIQHRFTYTDYVARLKEAWVNSRFSFKLLVCDRCLQ